MVTLDELKKLNDKELNEELQKAKIELLRLRFGVASKQNKETSGLKALRKYVARVKTMKRLLQFEQIKENSKSAVTK
ncbi:50S ribosomal protein L29 [Candidatus Peregrinibacteria bacterium]|nr:50S ribosomal protein L29 [Candidatus Peregrinibacteria bacterium]